MINFEQPENVGIGIAQGAASRLVADGHVLDYSGRVLNLASRLMELARPRGVVFDDGFGRGLVPEDVAARFRSLDGYLRGVSPDDKVTVHYVPDLTVIPASFSTPPSEIKWETATLRMTLKELESWGEVRIRVRLQNTPSDPSKIRCVVVHDFPLRGRRVVTRSQSTLTVHFNYELDALGPHVLFSTPDLAKDLRNQGVKGPWDLTIQVDYPVD